MPSEPVPTPVKPQPPLLLKVVCGIALALYATNVSQFLQAVAHPEVSPFPRWFAPAALAVCVGAMACLVGIWKMGKLAVLGYVLVTAGHNALLHAAHVWNVQSAL